MIADPIAVVLAYIALHTGHHAGDYLLQSDHQALAKGEAGRHGRWACTRHVAVLTAAQAVLLAVVAVATGTALDPAAALLGLAVNATSHWWADRRATLRGLVLATEPLLHKIGYYDSVGAGPIDQAWHALWVLPAALICAAPLPAALDSAGASLLVLAACHAVSGWGRRAEERRLDSAGAGR